MDLESLLLEDAVPGWSESLDVEAMIGRLFESAWSLQDAFQEQFIAQFQERFDLGSDEGKEVWAETLESLRDFARTQPQWIEDLFDGDMYWMTIHGHPGARIDWSTRWGLIEQGDRGVLYNVPDSDRGDPGLEVAASWSSDRDVTLAGLFLDEGREILENPEWGWSLSCDLPRPALVQALETIIGSEQIDWVKALLEVLAAKPWVTPELMEKYGRAPFSTASEAREFIDALAPGRAAQLSKQELERVQDLYVFALGESG